MIIIHVSGTPGSGKTTFGNKIKSLPDVYVVDTDDLLSEEDEEELIKLQGTGPPEDIHFAYRERWKAIFTQKLRKASDEASSKGMKILVFTGILNININSLSGDERVIMEMPFDPLQKYFIMLPTDRLVRQFYQRCWKDLGDSTEFWKGVADRRYCIPGSREYLDTSEKEKQWHVSHGYALASVEDIEKDIGEIVVEGTNKKIVR